MSDFYTMLAAHYNTVFPFSGVKKQFFENILLQYRPRTALDLGCATGELTGFLNRNRCQATGVDLNADLLAIARKSQPGRFVREDIVAFLSASREMFDLIICIGNTLPHLDPASRDRFAALAPRRLHPKGILILQTVNYHKILRHRPPGLPAIEKKEAGIKFTRRYQYRSDGSIVFTASLDSPQGQSQSSTVLWPYTARELKAMLAADFHLAAEYGSFAGEPFAEESPAWFYVAVRK